MADIEAHFRGIVTIASEHPEERAEICAAFQRILTDPHVGAWEVLMPAMHVIRWPEMKAWFEEKRCECIAAKDWRGEPVYRQIIAAFSDDWADRDMFPSLAKNT